MVTASDDVTIEVYCTTATNISLWALMFQISEQELVSAAVREYVTNHAVEGGNNK